jgi:uncharacterized repeat protein (TIGR01451 family)/CSLREA domain-containing protein
MRSFLRLFPAAVLVAACTVALPMAPASADVLTVNTNDDLDFGSCDPSHCSLREAIRESNTTPGTDTIAFDIIGPSKTISPKTPLPMIKDPVVVDATTQPGYTGAPVVAIRPGVPSVSGQPGLDVQAGDTVIRGLAIDSFGGASGIRLELEGGNVVEANYIGDFGPGAANGVGIAVASNGNVIGGTNPGSRNVVSKNTTNGIEVTGAANRIQGNYVGTDPSGLVGLPNANAGISVAYERNLVGGAAPGAGNLVSANRYGILLAGADQRVLGNRIGLSSAGGPLGNAIGVEAQVGLGHLIGGRAPNTVAYNRTGIEVDAQRGASQSSIRRNAIYDNTNLGIDLSPVGVTANDAGDPDTGPNNLQNYPVLTSAALIGSDVTIQGTLNSLASKTFLLDLYSNAACDPSGFGEGKNYLGSTLVTTDGAGNATFSKTLPAAVLTDRVFTATATAPGGDTSEFSKCVVRPPVADLSLTKTDKPDPATVDGELHYILDVHNGGPDSINKIKVTDTLPASMTFVSATPSQGSCMFTDLVICDLGTMAAGADAQIDISVTPTQTGEFTNSAVVQAGSGKNDPDKSDNEDTEATAVNP